MERILIIGANGQIGSELVEALAAQYGKENVIASDIAPGPSRHAVHYETLDVLDAARLAALVERFGITQIFHLAALLSATGETRPLQAWTLNMNGLLNVLELARERKLRVFWPSSIAAFGPHTPAVETPQLAIMDPTTMYGISKQAGERLCEYYFTKFGVDVRSLRYPGVISYNAAGRRHDRLCHRHLPGRAPWRDVHVLPEGRRHAADDSHAGRRARHAGTDERRRLAAARAFVV